jgi:hypothetical protein
MAHAPQTNMDLCFNCGRAVSDARQVAACLWKSPTDGREHWGAVPVCPACAEQRHRRQQMWLAVTLVVVTVLTAAAAYPLLP